MALDRIPPRKTACTIPRALRAGVTLLLTSWLALPGWQAAEAGPLRDRLSERGVQQQNGRAGLDSEEFDAEQGRAGAAALPAGVRAQRDVAYGPDPRQRYDVYLPASGGTAPGEARPVIFMVHGGGWRTGDKAMRAVVEHKAARWVSKGFVFISANYRLLPAAVPLQQADDVALAVAAAQRHAVSYGADPTRFILMGHSAGAHLVALLSAAPDLAYRAGVQPWLGTVALDSAALNVPGIMEQRHLPLYDKAFGADPQQWRAASPAHRLTSGALPLLAVCSSQRRVACPHARQYAQNAAQAGARVQVLEQPLSHAQINEQLGTPGSLTAGVEHFMGTLDPAVWALLR